jgi:hypothetical protein
MSSLLGSLFISDLTFYIFEDLLWSGDGTLLEEARYWSLTFFICLAKN